jgi:flagellar biosynthetic protein FliQ
MNTHYVVDIFSSAVYVSIVMICVTIVPSLIVGLLVSIFQAATQINEQTLSFLPKLIVTLLVLVFAGPWLGGLLMDFSRLLLEQLPELIDA